MDSAAEFFLWMSVIFPLVFSAGSGNLLCAISGASNGFAKSLPFILGLDVVYASYSLLAGFGLAVVVTRFPTLFFIVQILGVLYIFWLGIKFFLRSSVKQKEAPTQLTFIDGAISQALNIKGITIVLTMYSQFLDSTQLVYDVLTLTLALLLLNLFTHMTWAYGGAWIAQKFTSDYAVQIQSKIFGSMLIGVSVWLLYRVL